MFGSDAVFHGRVIRSLAAIAVALYGLGIIGAAQTRVEVYEIRPGGRTGAICRDGRKSFATGRGACSWHGGVARWTFTENRYREVRDTLLAEHEDTFWKLGHLSVLGLGTALWARSRSSVAHVRNDRSPSNVSASASPGSSWQLPPQPKAEHPSAPQTKQGNRRICPRCGGRMVRRVRRADGRAFLGCSNFPNCRYTRNIGHRPGRR